MNYVIPHRKEQAVFTFFEEISAISRPSGSEEAIAQYLVNFAHARKLTVFQDQANNVLIHLPASPDRQEEEPVILQGHTDMVFLTDEEHCDHPPSRPIQLRYDGKWVWAEGTTLGGDNGVAVAVMLAMADRPPHSRPPLELLFTASEEIGLLGAKAFDCSLLRGRRLINLDGGEEAVAVIGCAGGRRLDLQREIPTESVSLPALCLTLTGLQGGHSGSQIHQALGNGLKRMGELLEQVEDCHVVSWNGGTVDNAIPAQCELILLPSCQTKLSALEKRLKECSQTLLPQWKNTDPDATLELRSCTVNRIPKNFSLDFLSKLVREAPHGVQAYSDTHPDTVADSVNLAKIQTEEGLLKITFSARSFSEQRKEELCQAIARLAQSYGLSLTSKGDYPGWEPRSHSPLLDAYLASAQATLSQKARYYPIHAGLECGIFSRAIPNLDAISIGCDIIDIHSPDERLDADSLERLYLLMQDLLPRL